jgi:outer membrane receptor protein involved in Fe transport
VVTADKLALRPDAQTGSSTQLGPNQLAGLPSDRGGYQDILALVAGAQAGNPSTGVFSLRGLNQDNLFGNVTTGANSQIAVLDDGAPLSTATLRYLPPTLWQLGGVEVLRGPQSLSHGPNSLGGAILFHRREPGFARHGRAMTERAEAGGFRASLAQDVSLRPGELALNFSYHHAKTDGEEFNRFYNDRRLGANSREELRATLLWQSTSQPGTRVRLALVHDRARGNPAANVAEIAKGDLFQREVSLNTRPSYPANRNAATLNVSAKLPRSLQLASTTSAQQLAIKGMTDLDASSRLNWYARNIKDELRFTEDLTLALRRGALQWVIGGYAEKSTYTISYQGVGLAPLPLGSPFANRATETVRIGALYGRGDWEFHPGFHLNGGARLNREDRDFGMTATFGPFPARAGSSRKTENDLLPQAAVAWQPAPGRTLGLQIARGYRGGGTGYAPTLGLTRDFTAEYAWDTEVFARWAVTPALRVAAALFQSRLTDQQVPSNVPGGFAGIDTLVDNAAASRRSGLELETEWRVGPALTFTGAVSWVETEFRPLVLNGVDRAGQNFPNAPRWLASAGLNYQRPTGWFGSALLAYSSTSYSQVNSPRLTELEARRLLSARFGYAWKNIRGYLSGTNLLDARYALFRNDNTMLGLPVTGKAGASCTLSIGCEVFW